MGVPDMGLNPLTSQGGHSMPVISPQLVGHCARDLVPDCVSAPPTIPNVAFLYSISVQELFC